MNAKSLWSATKEVFAEFFDDSPFILAAALSFYTLLSLAPLLVVLVAAASMIWGQQAAQGQLVDQISAYTGQEGAEAIEQILANASGPGQGAWAMTIGIITLLIGATTVFAQLQTALNKIWEVEANPSNAIMGYVRTRLLSLGLLLVIGFLLLVSLVLSAVVSGARTYLENNFPAPPWVWQVLEIGVSLVVVTLLLALIFKYLPDVIIEWGDVWVGAIITAILFVIGKFGIGLYLGMASVGSAYGAAGSLVVLLVWVYYSALIVFLGAEITEVYAKRTGTPIRPSEHARAVGATASPDAATTQA